MWSEWSAREAPRALGAVGIAAVDGLGAAQRPSTAGEHPQQLRARAVATTAADLGR